MVTAQQVKIQREFEKKQAPKKEAAIAKRDAQNASKPNNELTINNEKPPMPLIRRDSSGNVTGVSLPNGDRFDGISSDAAQKIIDNWNNSNAAPANSMYEDVYNAQKQQAADAQTQAVQGDAIKADLQSQVGKPTPGLEAQVLQDNPQLQELNTDVVNNAMSRDANKGVAVTDTLYSLIPGGAAKKKIIKDLSAGVNPRWNVFLSGYSNEDNLAAIKDNLGFVDTDIETAKKLAAMPGQKTNSIMLYNAAQEKRKILYKQLYIISQTDQRAYTSEIKSKLTEIESYLQTGKAVDDKEMVDILYGAQTGVNK